MAISSKSKVSAKPAAKPAAPAAHNHKELEDKIAGLESKLSDALSKIAALEAKLAAPAAAASGKDEELREELKKYFATAFNKNLVTQFPNL